MAKAGKGMMGDKKPKGPIGTSIGKGMSIKHESLGSPFAKTGGSSRMTSKKGR